MLKISHVFENSLCAKSGILAGDWLISINQKKIKDIIDYLYYSADQILKIKILRKTESGKKIINFKLNRYLDHQPLGLNFESPTSDGIRCCDNNCIFCFVKQQPKGLRKELYIKDEDYRLSFLYGNFITGTNLTNEDLNRIFKLKLSPLYISVHATEPKIRKKLLGKNNLPDIVSLLKNMSDKGIAFHTQIVVIPGLNDGNILKQTISTLSTIEGVLTIGVVPVGLTCHRSSLYNIKAVDKVKALEIIKIVERFRKANSIPLIMAADELYLKAEQKLPGSKYYGDFEQFENGIGMVRVFLEDFKKLKRTKKSYIPLSYFKKIFLITGELFSPYLNNLALFLSEKFKIETSIIPVKNTLFGRKVNVAGLIAGKDLLNSLSKPENSIIVLPSFALDEYNRLIDNISLNDIEFKTDATIISAALSSKLVERLIKIGKLTQSVNSGKS